MSDPKNAVTALVSGIYSGKSLLCERIATGSTPPMQPGSPALIHEPKKAIRTIRGGGFCFYVVQGEGSLQYVSIPVINSVQIFILVFSISSRRSFTHIKNSMYPCLLETISSLRTPPPILIVGTQIEPAGVVEVSRRQVSEWVGNTSSLCESDYFFVRLDPMSLGSEGFGNEFLGEVRRRVLKKSSGVSNRGGGDGDGSGEDEDGGERTPGGSLQIRSRRRSRSVFGKMQRPKIPLPLAISAARVSHVPNPNPNPSQSQPRQTPPRHLPIQLQSPVNDENVSVTVAASPGVSFSLPPTKPRQGNGGDGLRHHTKLDFDDTDDIWSGSGTGSGLSGLLDAVDGSSDSDDILDGSIDMDFSLSLELDLDDSEEEGGEETSDSDSDDVLGRRRRGKRKNGSRKSPVNDILLSPTPSPEQWRLMRRSRSSGTLATPSSNSKSKPKPKPKPDDVSKKLKMSPKKFTEPDFRLLETSPITPARSPVPVRSLSRSVEPPRTPPFASPSKPLPGDVAAPSESESESNVALGGREGSSSLNVDAGGQSGSDTDDSDDLSARTLPAMKVSPNVMSMSMAIPRSYQDGKAVLSPASVEQMAQLRKLRKMADRAKKKGLRKHNRSHHHHHHHHHSRPKHSAPAAVPVSSESVRSRPSSHRPKAKKTSLFGRMFGTLRRRPKGGLRRRNTMVPIKHRDLGAATDIDADTPRHLHLRLDEDAMDLPGFSEFRKRARPPQLEDEKKKIELAPGREEGYDIHCYAYDGAVLEMVRLLKRGCDINQKDKFERTPLHYAALMNRRQIVRKLARRRDVVVDTNDRFGYTALGLAAFQGHHECVRILLQQGKADRTRVCGDHRCNPVKLSDNIETSNVFLSQAELEESFVRYARSKNLPGVVELLPKVDVDSVDKSNESALTAAISQPNNEEMVRVLLDGNALVEEKHLEADTPYRSLLECAKRRYRREQVVLELLKTEKTYCSDLGILVSLFVTPLTPRLGRIVRKKHLRQRVFDLFQNFVALKKCHCRRGFLNGLSRAVLSRTGAAPWSDQLAVVHHLSSINWTLYEFYNRHSADFLQKISTDRDYADLLRDFKRRQLSIPLPKPRDFPSAFGRPRIRLTKYRDLIARFLKACDPEVEGELAAASKAFHDQITEFMFGLDRVTGELQNQQNLEQVTKLFSDRYRCSRMAMGGFIPHRRYIFHGLDSPSWNLLAVRGRRKRAVDVAPVDVFVFSDSIFIGDHALLAFYFFQDTKSVWIFNEDNLRLKIYSLHRKLLVDRIIRWPPGEKCQSYPWYRKLKDEFFNRAPKGRYASAMFLLAEFDRKSRIVDFLRFNPLDVGSLEAKTYLHSVTKKKLASATRKVDKLTAKVESLQSQIDRLQVGKRRSPRHRGHANASNSTRKGTPKRVVALGVPHLVVTPPGTDPQDPISVPQASSPMILKRGF